MDATAGRSDPAVLPRHAVCVHITTCKAPVTEYSTCDMLQANELLRKGMAGQPPYACTHSYRHSKRTAEILVTTPCNDRQRFPVE